MLPSSVLERYFTKSVRQRGADYFHGRRVRIVHASNSYLEAEVKGSETYEQKIAAGGNIFTVACSCPYFRDNLIPCKHLWAVLLASDRESLLGSASSASDVTLKYGDVFKGEQASTFSARQFGLARS
ncbi:MAG: SWIM zinc finger family protein, partial [Acidobacteria bacterium]|nr:SWIM zinc finger family protein [Acidobacteriota bacterium]